jgi:hypothetical protein
MKRLLKLTVALGLVAALLIPGGMALAVLEPIPVSVDIKPMSCPNPLNVGGKGILPVAILGTDEFDVTTVDPATILANMGQHVSPLRWAYEDVATPYETDCGGCHELGPDGYLDLVLKFDTREVVDKYDLERHEDGAVVVLQITGYLKEEFSGSLIEGYDTIVVINKMTNQDG